MARTPNKKELQQFLGFVNFYQWFIEGFAKIAKPLTKLTGKEEWSWKEEQRNAFQGLKQQIAKKITLAIPADDGQFHIEVDASDFAMGGILSQQQKDETWQPVAFISKSLNSAEQNYEIYDKEMLTIMYAFYEWSHYLKGVKIPTEVLTDHQNLTYFKKPQNLNWRQARWVMDLQEYEFVIKYWPGKANTKADILSRRAGHDWGENDNQGVILLKKELFVQLHDDDSALEEILNKIRKINKRQWEEMVRKNVELKKEEWKIEQGLVTWKGRIYVPIDMTLWGSIIEIHHSWGHPGIHKTMELITQNYWWPGLQKDVQKYIQGCKTCQMIKPDCQAKPAPLQPNEILEKPWQIISMDMMGLLPESKGFNTILVVVNCFTKKNFFLPTHSTVTSKGITMLYWDRVFAEHGIPEKVISDQGSQFVSRFMKELFEVLKIKGNPSTAYHPQMDGQTERVNQEVKEFLTMFVNDRQDDWSDWLTVAQFCHNDQEHSATKHSPFFLNYGYHSRKGVEPKREYKVEAVKDFTEQITNVWDSATKALEWANKLMKVQYNKHKRPAINYEKGDKVYINVEHLPQNRPSKKLDKKFFGPYEVIKKVGASAYRIKIPISWKVYNIFNKLLLKPYYPPIYPNQTTDDSGENKETPHDIIDGEYKVEELLDSHISKRGQGWGKLEYLLVK